MLSKCLASAELAVAVVSTTDGWAWGGRADMDVPCRRRRCRHRQPAVTHEHPPTITH